MYHLTHYTTRRGCGSRPARFSFLVTFLALLALAAPARLMAATLPEGFTESIVARGLSNPTAMEFAPDGRLFVCEQGGRLRVIKNGTLLQTPFLTVPVNAAGERGLLGVTFAPDFANNPYVYVYYTATEPQIHNRVSRFTANGDVAVPGSEVVILELNNLSAATNHNGGALHFGEDGYLYIATGDNANSSNAQTLSNLLGKILRVHANGDIPDDNPFVTRTTGRNQAIYALGLRNPFTFTFQPGTSRFFINDVGQNRWEEINNGVAGANYGWPETEGPTNDARYRGPIFAYEHGEGGTRGCAITGGAFYNPANLQFPAQFQGRYFFADFCNGWIRTLNPTNNTAAPFATGLGFPVDLKVHQDGSLYYLSRTGGIVGRIAYTASQTPTITTQPGSLTVSPGEAATFSVIASGSASLRYQWQRNGVNIAGATASSYTLASPTVADNGARFRVVVSNSFGSVTSAEATLTVTANRAPVGTITAPASGALYRAGDTIAYSGTATDAEDGALPARAFTWRVDFHHAGHVHPFLPDTSGARSGSFTVPTTGETATDVFYRIILTVRDSDGMTHTSFVDIRPRTVTLSFRTQPAGLQITVDGQPRRAPFSFTAVVGMTREIGAPSPQRAGGATHEFVSWSDGGAATHTLTVPQSDTTYTAVFRRGGPAATGRLVVSPKRLGFGTVNTGQTRSRTLRLRNAGRGPLTVTVGTPSAPFTVTSGGGSFTLAPRERRTVTVQFAPVSGGPATGELRVTSDDPRRGAVTIRLSGVGR